MLQDVGYLQSRLGRTEGFEGVGEYLMDIIRSKDVKFVPKPLEPGLVEAQVGSAGESKREEEGNGNGNGSGSGNGEAEGGSGSGAGEA